MNKKEYKFKAIIKKNPDMDAAYIEFPYDVEKEFSKKRVFVTAKFNGYVYNGSLVRMGTTCHVIGIRKDIRKYIGKQPGDTIEVIIKEREHK